MSNRECIDNELGELLHAYELNSLSEEGAERFDIHLLECAYCFNEVKAFEPNIGMLKSDDLILNQIHDVLEKTSTSAETPTLVARVWNYIWPDSPLVFRPAFMFLIILLLIYPAFLGLNPTRKNEIKTISAINLFPGRSAGAESFKVEPGEDILLNFIFRDVDSAKNYIVELSDINGNILMHDKSYTDFDAYDMGRLLLPSEIMKPGIYILMINDPSSSSPEDSLTYRFKIDM